jgi:hypothetical protein
MRCLRAPGRAVLLLLAQVGCHGAITPADPVTVPPAPRSDAAPRQTPSLPDADAADANAPRPDATPDAAAVPDATPDAAAPLTGVAAVFDLDRLHRIELTVATADLAQLEMDQENRVPCDVTFDGIALPHSAVRKKGGPGSLRPLAEKPAFSIKFNELVKGQKLNGLSKLLLNNAVMDDSFLNEHLAYELARRAGNAAPLTAHGLVTFNGRPLGLYVVREAFNDDFAERNWGKQNQGGNFYEGGEFVDDPNSPELKDENEEMRKRDDVVAASRAVKGPADATWVAAVSARLDLQSFITGWVVEALSDHWDGYFFGPHNYYLYHHPGTDRLVFLVAGMDNMFGRVRDVRDDPKVQLATKIMQLPETRARLHDTLARIVRDLDLPALQARIDRAARTIHTATPTDPATIADYKRFDDSLREAKSDMAAIKGLVVPAF